MPKGRLLMMGLLSKQPQKSSILKSFASADPKRRYTEYEKMHITALYFTPEISRKWLGYQFEKLGMDPVSAIRKLRRVAYVPKNKYRWEHLGAKNLKYIGTEEAVRYGQRRRPGTILRMTSWMLMAARDLKKQGHSLPKIAEMMGVSYLGLYLRMRDSSIFDFNQPRQKYEGQYGTKSNKPEYVPPPRKYTRRKKKCRKSKKKSSASST